MNCSPQRYLANNLNLLREATLTPSSVQPVEDSVIEVPTGRVGTAQVELTGAYTGAEEALYEIEILDDTVSTKLVSTPVATGAGSGTLSDISATAAAQTFRVQLANAGIPTLKAGIDFEGVRIVARADGDVGNTIAITIDQSTLVFTPQDFSLLTDLKAGSGGPTTGLEGAAYDWDSKVLSADAIIPANAHRVSFGDDTGTVYLQYKQYTDGVWLYHFVPAIKRDIPKGTRINFVTGGRTVTIEDTAVIPASPAEPYADIETVYDLLNAIRTTSVLVDVDGVVAYDRSPTGQASKELLARTDAHVEPSTGSGSSVALGFEDTFANSNAATELVTATCIAVTAKDHPLARVGRERWKLAGSVSGDLGEIVTDEPFTDPSGKFGLTIPLRLPDGFGTQKGRFSYVGIAYEPRGEGIDPYDVAAVCPVGLKLGPEAVDQTLTLVYTKRPSGDCICTELPIPNLSGPCLGDEQSGGESAVGYQSDTNTRLIDLRDWYAETVRDNSAFSALITPGVFIGSEDPFLNRPNVGVDADPSFDAKALKEIVDNFERAIALIDVLVAGDSPDYRGNGMIAWDVAVAELKYDVDAFAAEANTNSIPSDRYLSRLDWVIASAGLSPLGKADATTLRSGDGCWQDYGDGFYWEVAGSENGAYAPAFNNQKYWGSRLSEDGKAYFSTHEFAFQINVKCPENLLVGDTITLQIGGAAWGATYTVGDELTLPIIAEQPLQLAGGQDGNAILDWYVSGSVAGALPMFSYDPDAPTTYSAGGLDFTYTPGGIPNAKGDAFEFTIEGGHYRFRKDGGAWMLSSPPEPIPDGPDSFDSGLSIEFISGAYPSFVTGDMFVFRARQPWAVSNLQTPSKKRWQWTGSAPNIVADIGSEQAVTMFAVARHTLPAGTTLLLEGGVVAGVYTWSESLTYSAGEIVKEFAAQTARYVRLTLANATGGGIGWMPLFNAALTTTLSAAVQLRKSYKIEPSGGGLDQGGKYLGRATSGTVGWSEAALIDADVDGIAAMLDWIKEHDDEPFCIVPNITRPTEAFMQHVAVDEVEFEELSDYNAAAGARDRRYTISMPLSGVWK